MTLPIRPILSVFLLIGGFICLAVGLVSFKQLQISAPETLPKNMVAVTPTPPPVTATPTVTLPQIGVKLVTTASGSAQVVLANPQAIKVTGLSLRLTADRQLAAPAVPFTLNPKLTQIGFAAAVNSLTLDHNQSFFDLALAALQPGGLNFTATQSIASLPVAVTHLRVDPDFSRLIDNQNTTYQLVTWTK